MSVTFFCTARSIRVFPKIRCTSRIPIKRITACWVYIGVPLPSFLSMPSASKLHAQGLLRWRAFVKDSGLLSFLTGLISRRAIVQTP